MLYRKRLLNVIMRDKNVGMYNFVIPYNNYV